MNATKLSPSGFAPLGTIFRRALAFGVLGLALGMGSDAARAAAPSGDTGPSSRREDTADPAAPSASGQSGERADRKRSSSRSSSKSKSRSGSTKPSSSPPSSSSSGQPGASQGGASAQPYSPQGASPRSSSGPATTPAQRDPITAPTRTSSPRSPQASPSAQQRTPAAGPNEAAAREAQDRPNTQAAQQRGSSASAAPRQASVKVPSTGSSRGQAARSDGHRSGPPPSAAAHQDNRPHHSNDHRYARPASHHLRHHPQAHHGPPAWSYYRPYYSHWWVHPYYRWTHATVTIAWLGFTVYAWDDGWMPPARAGWAWMPGHWEGAYWVPGYWTPVGVSPYWYGRSYVYVPGWWVGDVYVEGYYRADRRDQGDWTWVDGYYLEDGTFVWGQWVPTTRAPDGYVWVAGFWDGEQYIDGFWRPESRRDYVWVGAWLDDEGVYHSGYWEPTVAQPGMVWIPGWFDGQTWVEGYWVSEIEYQRADPQNWEPEEGWNDGWDESESAAPAPDDQAEPPLALPVSAASPGGAEGHAPPPGSEG